MTKCLERACPYPSTGHKGLCRSHKRAHELSRISKDIWWAYLHDCNKRWLSSDRVIVSSGMPSQDPKKDKGLGDQLYTPSYSEYHYKKYIRIPSRSPHDWTSYKESAAEGLSMGWLRDESNRIRQCRHNDYVIKLATRPKKWGSYMAALQDLEVGQTTVFQFETAAEAKTQRSKIRANINNSLRRRKFSFRTADSSVVVTRLEQTTQYLDWGPAQFSMATIREARNLTGESLQEKL